MSRREGRDRLHDGRTPLMEHRINLFCTGYGHHDRWNLGAIVVVGLGTDDLVVRFRPKRHEVFTHRVTKEERARLSLDELLERQGRRDVFRCQRCPTNIPMRAGKWDDIGKVLLQTGVSDMDIAPPSATVT